MRKSLSQQTIPILLTILTFVFLGFLLFAFIHLLNLFPIKNKIIPTLTIADILVGLTIYLKTSIDFAIFIGNLMAKNPGWKKRIAIELGTALGNGFGTLIVLTIWTFFKEVPLLLIAMIALAALVLLGMAEKGLKELFEEKSKIANFLLPFAKGLYGPLHIINHVFSPLVRLILPHASTETQKQSSFLQLGFFSLTIPFILGLDDFAGYIPLFTIVNVFGFAIGIFLGHMLLNIALFASPTNTVHVVKQPLIVFTGSLAFIAIALWGLYEIYRLTATLFLH